MKNKLKLFFLLIVYLCYSCNNNIEVDCENLTPNDIEIYLSAGIPLRYNKNPTLIYKDDVCYDIPNEYGENDWLVIYKGQEKCIFRHFKTNRRHTHKYKFVFYEKHDTLFCAIDFHGKDAKKDTFFLQKNR